MSVQKTKKRFLESVSFTKIFRVVRIEEEVIEISYKITTVTLNTLHIKPLQSNSYQLIND